MAKASADLGEIFATVYLPGRVLIKHAVRRVRSSPKADILYGDMHVRFGSQVDTANSLFGSDVGTIEIGLNH